MENFEDLGLPAPEQPEKNKKKTPAPKTEEQPAAAVEAYESGFKVPLEIHPQHATCDMISFRRGGTEYKLSPSQILKLAQNGKILNGVSVGKLQWKEAVGLLVNNLDGGRNKAFNDMMLANAQDIIDKSLS